MNFSEINYHSLFYSKHLFYKYANMKRDDTSFPNWRKRGVEAVIPLAFYYLFYNAFL